MDDLLRERCLKYAAHISGLCGVECVVMDIAEKCFVGLRQDELKFCNHCTYEKRNLISTHLYGSYEAYRWNGKYIYYCPRGLVFVASSVSDDHGLMTASMIAGPIVMGDLNDAFEDMPDHGIRGILHDIPNYSTARVNHLAEIRETVTAYINMIPHSRVGTFVYEQEKILNSFYSVQDIYRDNHQDIPYPIEQERRLQKLILAKDKQGAQELLNELLGHIFFSSDFNIERIKGRILELMVLLSRSTIDAGANPNEIFYLNDSYREELAQMTELEEISVWISGIMHLFFNYTFDFTQIKHSDVVYKVMQYVKANYVKKLTLEEIAGCVYLSKSYLSTTFKDEMGVSLSSYINQVRVEKSKQLLLDGNASLVEIANLCGFEDQSYFTKVFKKSEGVSPKVFRDARGKAR
ncbi:helix-turn-helix domain-containing protein [Anaerotruncus sp. AF02-27]|uniref:helix-turn-helix domain-containing protein n=1 Tax=Anaerotruncus sp. AF02-27 TaxID=2292191 RepID=UPI000E539B10|nr:helix-turn-helix domain-containing protein [Anaerotruncus sp. AF02-27]RGX57009.1 helix-turn-helix domain-containing protein [Anaerotruncus sp. AF02-27]